MAGTRSVLISGARAPVALHMARLLNAAGHRVTLVDHLKRPVSASGQFANCYRSIPPFTSDPEGASAALTHILAAEDIDVVIPTCEEVLHLAALWARLRPNAGLFAPEHGLLSRAHSKHGFIRLCKEIGLPVPETHLLTSQDALRAFRSSAGDMVFKPVWSRFGSAVLIRPRPSDLDRVRPTGAAPWVAQTYLQGREINAYAVARNGRVVALAAYRALVRAGPGAAVCFEPADPEPTRDFVDRFAAATAWTGQMSFDLIATSDGQILPLECNPRATSGLHFFTRGAAFSDALFGHGDAANPDVADPLAVRLALWLYGLPMILRRRDRRAFFDALQRARDVMAWPGDRVTFGAQIRSLAEIAGIAVRHRVTLERASTWGIEWNGSDQSSIS